MYRINTTKGVAIIDELPNFLHEQFGREVEKPEGADENEIMLIVTSEEERNIMDNVASRLLEVHGYEMIHQPEVQKTVSEVFKDAGYYILPSSIHEVLCIPKSIKDVNALNKMVHDINRSCVAEEDILGWETLEVVDGEVVAATA